MLLISSCVYIIHRWCILNCDQKCIYCNLFVTELLDCYDIEHFIINKNRILWMCLTALSPIKITLYLLTSVSHFHWQQNFVQQIVLRTKTVCTVSSSIALSICQGRMDCFVWNRELVKINKYINLKRRSRRLMRHKGLRCHVNP